MIHITNKKLLIKPITEMTSLGNGLQINNETQSRKDVVTGICVDGTYKDSKVYYPLYAAFPITYKGENYLIIDEQDILAFDNDPENY